MSFLSGVFLTLSSYLEITLISKFSIFEIMILHSNLNLNISLYNYNVFQTNNGDILSRITSTLMVSTKCPFSHKFRLSSPTNQSGEGTNFDIIDT